MSRAVGIAEYCCRWGRRREYRTARSRRFQLHLRELSSDREAKGTASRWLSVVVGEGDDRDAGVEADAFAAAEALGTSGAAVADKDTAVAAVDEEIAAAAAAAAAAHNCSNGPWWRIHGRH